MPRYFAWAVCDTQAVSQSSSGFRMVSRQVLSIAESTYRIAKIRKGLDLICRERGHSDPLASVVELATTGRLEGHFAAL